MVQNMPRSQYYTVLTLSLFALFLAIVWLIYDNISDNPTISLEPIVVMVASSVPILTLWWPFKPKYRSKRKRGTLTVELDLRSSGIFGVGETQFEPSFSTNSSTSVHMRTFNHPNHVGARVLSGVNHFEDVKDASTYEISNVDISPDINDIVLLKNRYGIYSLIKIKEINRRDKCGNRDLVKFEYVINTTGGVNFS